MNRVELIGRTTHTPKISNGKTTVASFSLAINRGKDKDGNDLGADFPNIKCFGKTAELVEKYLGKGKLVGISGHIATGKYEKDGKNVYTTDVIADRVEFLEWGEKGENNSSDSAPTAAPVEGFSVADDLPF